MRFGILSSLGYGGIASHIFRFHLARAEGYQTCRETIRHSMREMGLEAIYPKPNLSQPNPQHKVYPYLLKNVTASYPNHIWGIDITYIRLHSAWLFLVAVMDWFSRYVLAWQLSDTLEIPFVLAAVDQAMAQEYILVESNR